MTLECCLWVSAKSVIYWQSHKPSQATNADKQRPSNSQKLSTGSKMQLICGLNCILKLTEAKHTSIGQPFSFTFQVSPLHILKGTFVAVICSYIVTLMKMNDSHAENDLQRKAKKKKIVSQMFCTHWRALLWDNLNNIRYALISICYMRVVYARVIYKPFLGAIIDQSSWFGGQ